MELDEAGLVFTPSLEVGSDRGFLALVDGLVNDIYNAAKLIPRLAKGRLNYKVSRRSVLPLPRPRFEIARVDGAQICVLSDGCAERDREPRGPQSPPASPGRRPAFPPQAANPVLPRKGPSPWSAWHSLPATWPPPRRPPQSVLSALGAPHPLCDVNTDPVHTQASGHAGRALLPHPATLSASNACPLSKRRSGQSPGPAADYAIPPPARHEGSPEEGCLSERRHR